MLYQLSYLAGRSRNRAGVHNYIKHHTWTRPRGADSGPVRYLDDAAKGFTPPAPFTLSELDPAGVLPDRIYGRDELLSYLEPGRAKARARIVALSAESAREPCDYGWMQPTRLESLLYSMRHVQHYAAQLNLLLRQTTNSAPDWVARTDSSL